MILPSLRWHVIVLDSYCHPFSLWQMAFPPRCNPLLSFSKNEYHVFPILAIIVFCPLIGFRGTWNWMYMLLALMAGSGYNCDSFLPSIHLLEELCFPKIKLYFCVIPRVKWVLLIFKNILFTSWCCIVNIF